MAFRQPATKKVRRRNAFCICLSSIAKRRRQIARQILHPTRHSPCTSSFGHRSSICSLYEYHRSSSPIDVIVVHEVILLPYPLRHRVTTDKVSCVLTPDKDVAMIQRTARGETLLRQSVGIPPLLISIDFKRCSEDGRCSSCGDGHVQLGAVR